MMMMMTTTKSRKKKNTEIMNETYPRMDISSSRVFPGDHIISFSVSRLLARPLPVPSAQTTRFPIKPFLAGASQSFSLCWGNLISYRHRDYCHECMYVFWSNFSNRINNVFRNGSTISLYKYIFSFIVSFSNLSKAV